MKTFIVIVLFGIGAYFGYQKVFNSHNTVEITGNLQVSQYNNYDIDAPRVSGQLYTVTVHGIAHNTGGKMVKNVFIEYKIAGHTTSATIFDIAPGQQILFTTNSIKIKRRNPSFSLEAVQFEESD
ncbi:hypothetical protein BMS3Abin03_02379 [bacterium BMS3Abin03]|nr:hypothetical protein BMS3Abin03_02379 [bacterium BMS3Abin03]